MEAAEDAVAVAAPESWGTANLNGAMSRLLLSSDDDEPARPEQAQQNLATANDLVAQVDQFLREALEKPRERLSGKIPP
jgi:large subunit ribosomal protein L10Ae